MGQAITFRIGIDVAKGVFQAHAVKVNEASERRWLRGDGFEAQSKGQGPRRRGETIEELQGAEMA